MRSLDSARDVCETFLPGLLGELAEIPLERLESAGNPGIEAFRRRGGPALVIPKAYSGIGADPLRAVQTLRAIGAAAPSTAVATTMHHFSVATLFALADSVKNSGMEWALLEGIAEQSLLVASGFAEGRPGQGILSPTMSAVPVEGGYLVSGAKRPCSLSVSMDLLTASVALPVDVPDGPDGPAGAEPRMAVLLIPKETPGIEVHPFWMAWALAGAESDEVRLTDVFVDEQLMMPTEAGELGELDELQTIGFIWFELLISASYLGMASALVERVLARGRGHVTERAAVASKLETAALLLEGVARMVMDGETSNDALGKTLVSRYAVQDALGEAVRGAVELLGGMAFVQARDTAYLAAVTHALTLHPPSRSSVAQPLADYFGGRPMRLA
ncbi:acyl-CoA/acyl-ACP dehydrogenase [Streptosporangiaceae bacterium NEAU-GS5]|nr:acyl-CoA/acyl-ACP dehydrogenase [Streptosporangiaceae bacterium NEAU-GS5]